MQPIRLAPLALLWILLGPASLPAQSDLSFEPYTVFVIERDAHARCGPSDEYYRTDPLRHGQALEVYAETDDGWLGVRPPEDSFCWIQAETVEVDPAGQLATVIEDRTVAWIGTHLGRARSYRWQVQMATGEEVTIIGKSEREGPDGPQLWYRIVPPSGEYRWVHRDQVVDSSEKLVEASRHANQSEAARTSAQPTTDSTATTSGLRTLRSPTLGDRYVESAGTSSSRRQRDRSEQPSLEAINEVSNLQPAPTPAADRSTRSAETWQTNENRLAVDHYDAQVGAPNDMSPSGAPAQADSRSVGSASATFIGRPKLLEIGSRPSAPATSVAAGDANWVTGTSPRVTTTHQPTGAVSGASVPNPVAQVAGESPAASQSWTVAGQSAPLKMVSPERIANIEAEVAGADIERLDLIFSRFMAARASAAEVEPIAAAATRLSRGADDPAVAGRARMLIERAQQYQRLARRRDGRTIVGHTGAVQIPANDGASVSPTSMIGTETADAGQTNGAGGETAYIGFLVQVYSARTNSPPFALTDNTGRTIAYVTPTPGTNLRVHLNSKVRIAGTPGFVTGLNTPHILAGTVSRTIE